MRPINIYHNVVCSLKHLLLRVAGKHICSTLTMWSVSRHLWRHARTNSTHAFSDSPPPSLLLFRDLARRLFVPQDEDFACFHVEEQRDAPNISSSTALNVGIVYKEQAFSEPAVISILASCPGILILHDQFSHDMDQSAFSLARRERLQKMSSSFELIYEIPPNTQIFRNTITDASHLKSCYSISSLYTRLFHEDHLNRVRKQPFRLVNKCAPSVVNKQYTVS